MTREQWAQKRAVNAASAVPPSGSNGSSSISVPPKKRPRLPDFGAIESEQEQLPNHSTSAAGAPLDLSAKQLSPRTVEPAAADNHSQWQQAAAAAAAAAMYAQYMSYLNSLAVMPHVPPMLPPVLPPPPPPPPPPPHQLAAMSSGNKSNSGGETDFHCATCGRTYASLVGLTVHMKSAGHCSAATAAADAATAAIGPAAEESAAPAAEPIREMPKLVRGQDMWINSETEQTREILRCIRCGQSYRSLPDLTMHMVRTGHYAEIISNSSSSPAASSGCSVVAGHPQDTSPRLTPSKPQQQVSPLPPAKKQLPLALKSAAADPARPAYLCPDLAPRRPGDTAGGFSGDSNPLSCLQRLVDKTAASSDASAAGYSSAAAAAAAAVAANAPAASPSAASSSSTSEAASVIVVADIADDGAGETATLLSSPPMLSTRRPDQQKQKLQQQQQSLQKKTKCQFCARPFANKGQVRLHVSKGKCPGGGRGAAPQQAPQPTPPPLPPQALPQAHNSLAAFQQHNLALLDYIMSGAARVHPTWWL